MKTKTKVGIGIGVVVLIVAALLATNTGIFKGSLRGVAVPTYSGARWQCYDGTSANRQGVLCKTSAAWSSEAQVACANKCSPISRKCGVNSFLVSSLCAQPVAASALSVSLGADTPLAATIVGNTTNNNIATFNFAAANEDINIRDISLSLGGTLDKAFIRNVKLVNKTTGWTLDSVAVPNNDGVLAFSSDFTVQKDSRLSVNFVVDILQGAPGGATLFVSIPNAASIRAQGIASGNAIVPNGNFPIRGNVMTVTSASLTVDRAIMPVSQTVVKGQRRVDLLGLDFKAGDASDVTVRDITIRLMADSDGTFNNGYGDTAANTMVDTVSLFWINADGSLQSIAGPAGLRQVGAALGTDMYYSASFTDDFTIFKSGNRRVLIKVDLKNTIASTKYLAADLVLNGAASNDIAARDADGNAVYAVSSTGAAATGINGLIGTSRASVVMTVVTSGALTGAQEGSPDSSIGVAGSTGVVMSRYKFTAANEAFTITKLDVIATGSTSIAFNQVIPNQFAGGNNISRVGIIYPKSDGASETVYANINQGKARFTNLRFYVPKDGNAVVAIIADLNTIDFGATSGARVRLGLNENATIATNSFEAMGEGSSEIKNATNVNAMANSNLVNAVVIRKTMPTVAKLAGASTRLNNGQNDIAAITISADAREVVSLKRLKFAFNSAGVDVNALELYRKIGGGGEASITNNVSIENRAVMDPADPNRNATGSIYVTWIGDREETINRGITNTYTLRANVANAGADSVLSTYIADDTTFVAGDTANGVVGGNYNFVWSDNSAPAHSTATRDWTNGTDVISLPTSAQSLSF